MNIVETIVDDESLPVGLVVPPRQRAKKEPPLLCEEAKVTYDYNYEELVGALVQLKSGKIVRLTSVRPDTCFGTIQEPNEATFTFLRWVTWFDPSEIIKVVEYPK